MDLFKKKKRFFFIKFSVRVQYINDTETGIDFPLINGYVER